MKIIFKKILICAPTGFNGVEVKFHSEIDTDYFSRDMRFLGEAITTVDMNSDGSLTVGVEQDLFYGTVEDAKEKIKLLVSKGWKREGKNGKTK